MELHGRVVSGEIGNAQASGARLDGPVCHTLAHATAALAAVLFGDGTGPANGMPWG